MIPPAAPLTEVQERGWREAIQADRWGSVPRWSSQSVAALLATLDEARAGPAAANPIVPACPDPNCSTDGSHYHRDTADGEEVVHT